MRGLKRRKSRSKPQGMAIGMARASMDGDMTDSGVLGGHQTVGGDIEAFVIMIDPEMSFVIH